MDAFGPDICTPEGTPRPRSSLPPSLPKPFSWLHSYAPPPTWTTCPSGRRTTSDSRVCARRTLRSAPHRHQRIFFGTCVCNVTNKHLLQPLISHIQSFGNLGQLLKIPCFSANKSNSAGILICLLLRSPCKILEPYANPFWEKSM